MLYTVSSLFVVKKRVVYIIKQSCFWDILDICKFSRVIPGVKSRHEYLKDFELSQEVK